MGGLEVHSDESVQDQVLAKSHVSAARRPVVIATHRNSAKLPGQINNRIGCASSEPSNGRSCRSTRPRVSKSA